jgi:hypothetical protein
MKAIITVLALLISAQVNATTYCNPAKSTPCGRGCVAIGKKCTKDWSTSVAGVNPDSGAGKHYEASEVKHVAEAPSEATNPTKKNK